MKGFEFQQALALIKLIESIQEPEFTTILIEGPEDVETRFERQGKAKSRLEFRGLLLDPTK